MQPPKITLPALAPDGTQAFANPDSSKAYTPAGLSIYDTLVVHGFAPLVWGCKPGRLIDHYDQFVSPNHIDVGVGTGYFLDRCRFPSTSVRLALVDQRESCLAYTSKRLARYTPQTWRRDVTVPFDIPVDGFDSLCLGGVLHCLNGSVSQKCRVLDHITFLLNPGARVFGYTLVQDGISESLRRRGLNYLLNRMGVISNQADTTVLVRNELSSRFKHCRVEQQGTFALFSAIYHP